MAYVRLDDHAVASFALAIVCIVLTYLFRTRITSAFQRLPDFVKMVMLLIAIIYGLVANYRLKQLNCSRNTTALGVFRNDLFQGLTYGLHGFLFGEKHRNDRYIREG